MGILRGGENEKADLDASPSDEEETIYFDAVDIENLEENVDTEAMKYHESYGDPADDNSMEQVVQENTSESVYADLEDKKEFDDYALEEKIETLKVELRGIVKNTD